MNDMEQRGFEQWVLRNYGPETSEIWVRHNFDGLYAAYQKNARIMNEPPPPEKPRDRYDEI